MSSKSKGYYGIAFKFSAKQINLVRKEKFRDLRNNEYYVDFRIFVNACQSVFLKKDSNKNKIKTTFLRLTAWNVFKYEEGAHEGSFWD